MDSHDTIYPFWRLCVTQIAKGAPSNLKIPVGIKLEVYSIEGLREFLRLFTSAPKETEQSRPYRIRNYPSYPRRLSDYADRERSHRPRDLSYRFPASGAT